LLLSIIPSPIPSDLEAIPFLQQQYQRLEAHFQERCAAAERAHSIIRIPLLSLPALVETTSPSPLPSRILSLLESQKRYSSLFLSATLTQKLPFATLEDLGRGITQLVSAASTSAVTVSDSVSNSSAHGAGAAEPMKGCYHLYSSLSSDADVLSILSQLWSEEISYQPVSLSSSLPLLPLLLLFILLLLLLLFCDP
jgi:hypothetical protein